MLRRVLFALLLSPLMACAQSEAPTAAAPAAEAPAATAAPAPAAEAPAPATVEAPAAAATPAAEAPAVPAMDSAAATQVASNQPAALVLPTGETPRPGIDYEILEAPQPTWGRGKIEVAEVFGYTCIHCAHFQPILDAWLKSKPADIRYEYVPAVFGGAWDAMAKAFYAAETLGVRERTHDAVFKKIHEDKALQGISDEEIADLYASLGVDRAKFLAAMKSFGINAKLGKARQFATRTGVNATPTIIINGKYRLNSTRDRGFEGMLHTIDYLAAYERAGQSPPAGAP